MPAREPPVSLAIIPVASWSAAVVGEIGLAI